MQISDGVKIFSNPNSAIRDLLSHSLERTPITRMEPVGSAIELSINSNFLFIELVASVTDNITQLVGFGEEEAHWIGLSVRESVINAIKHGNKLDISKQVDVKFLISDTEIIIFVRDRGEGFDPSCIPNPLEPSNLIKPNGRGIFYMRTFMDEVVFSNHPQGGTVVKMLKRKVNTDKCEDKCEGESNVTNN